MTWAGNVSEEGRSKSGRPLGFLGLSGGGGFARLGDFARSVRLFMCFCALRAQF